jgi:hypothetical protein
LPFAALPWKCGGVIQGRSANTPSPTGDIVVVGSAGGRFLADQFTRGGAQDPTFNNGAPLLFGTASDRMAIFAPGRDNIVIIWQGIGAEPANRENIWTNFDDSVNWS